MLDLALAITHHLLIFALFGILVAELVLVRRGVDPAGIAKVARIDLGYGVLAGLIIAAGLSRAVFAAKGWTYYSHNGFFWAKMATFLLVGLLSAPPTIAYIQWRRRDTGPSDAEIGKIRRYLFAQLILFALLPAFAAAMARGFGEFH